MSDVDDEFAAQLRKALNEGVAQRVDVGAIVARGTARGRQQKRMRRAVQGGLAVMAVAAIVPIGGGLMRATNSDGSASVGGGVPSPPRTTLNSTATALEACTVLDISGGVEDRWSNQSSWQGMKDAQAANPNIKISYVPSQSDQDYIPNLNAEVAKGCGTTIAVGGLMTDAVKATAAQNTGKKFAIIDSNTGQPNVYGIQFNTAQDA